MMDVDKTRWNDPDKQAARLDTTIYQYRKHFGHAIPSNKQYWTMCGQCAEHGIQLEGTEIDQVIKAGLVTPDQFHGVEINPGIHAENIRAYEDHPSHWYCQDFYQQMVTAAAERWFNPGIVNADTTKTPETGRGSVVIGKIMAMLTDTSNDFLFIANMVLRTRHYRQKTGDYFISMMDQDPSFRYAWDEGKWEILPKYYEYTRKVSGSRTNMGSFIFVYRR